jgi:transposase
MGDMECPSLAPEVLAALPKEVVAFIHWLMDENTRLRGRVAELEAEVASLKARLNQNSSNSSKPPSTDLPSHKPAPKKGPTGKRPGGQPGHQRHVRPPRTPTQVVDLIPDTCRCCGHLLLGYDPQPHRRQVVEVPEIRPEVVEYRMHQLKCLHCGNTTRAATPPEAHQEYGARLQAVLALCSGEFRLGKRKIAALCADFFGVAISIGQVCALEEQSSEVLQPIVEEAEAYVKQRPANVDETGWKEGKKRGWLWVAATRLVAVFAIRGSRSRATFEQWLGSSEQVRTTDRYSVYSHLPPERRQLCWAHLRRDFQAMIDRGNAGKAIGQELLELADLVLSQWKRVREGTLSREAFQAEILPDLQTALAATLHRGGACRCAKTVGVCMELRRWQPSLWTFAHVPEVEPTNNAAERAVRHAVCWRKTSYGTASAAGSRFVERILSVVASCRLQGRKALDFLTRALQAARTGNPYPSLLPA